MNVLMLSIGDGFLKGSLGDEVTRHVQYACQAEGQIHMITYSLAASKLTHREFEHRFFVYPSRSSGMWSFPYDAYQLAKALCQKISFDVIYSQDPFATALVGTWLRKRAGIPLIIGNHSNFLDNKLWIAERPLFFTFLNQLAKYTLPRADAWRVLNENERAIYTQLHLPTDRIYILNTPIALDNFQTRVEPHACLKLRKKLGIAAASPVLLWVGRPVKFKRLPLLLKAFRLVIEHLPEARCVLIGKKALQQEPLDTMIEDQGLSRHVLWVEDGVPHAELSAYYQMANAYAHTSHYEGFGKVMVEAAASGLPIVATDTAGARRILRDGQTGFLVPVDDARAFAKQVIWLFEHPEEARLMGQHGRHHVFEHFDQTRDTAKIVAMWRDVAGASQRCV